MSDRAPIGIFDSGVGGLSVWREIRRQLPGEDTVYVADQANLPYGPRPAEQIREFSRGIVDFLIAEGCRTIVVGCNTASAVALADLRSQHPKFRFVGMEPAIKPAALATRSGKVGVMATPATLAGALFTATAGRYASHVRIIGEPCGGLVEAIESRAADADARRDALLREIVGRLVAAGVDQIVLACTHYPFVAEAIRVLAGSEVEVIDPAPAVVRQLMRVLGDERSTDSTGRHRFYTTGVTRAFAAALLHWVDVVTEPRQLNWRGSALATDIPALEETR
jgi:glutamate racemase